MKGKVLQQYHLLLVENRLEKFEQKFSSHFLFYFGKVLPLEFSYLGWLINRIRPYQNRNPLGLNASLIHAHYIKQFSLKEFQDKLNFITFLQFLVYAAQLPYETRFLGSTNYIYIC